MPTKLKSTGVEFPDNTTQTTEGVTSVSAGNALTGGGSGSSVTINHEDTSSQGSVSNSDSDVIQSVTLDDFGHVTGLSSTSISAGGLGTTRERLNGSGTFTVPSGVEKIRVFIVGAGGGCGADSDTDFKSGSFPGGGGGLNVQDINTSPGATFSYSSGSGGSGGTTGNGGSVAASGGTSSFGGFSAGGGERGGIGFGGGGSGGGSGCDGNGSGSGRGAAGGGSGGFGGGATPSDSGSGFSGTDGGGGASGDDGSTGGDGGDGFIVVEY